jgi:selenide,water dikinase
MARPIRDLVLVGGGHAHVQVLRAFEMRPPASTRLTLLVDVPVAVYSGMVPGFVAGQYTADDLEIDCLPLARRAGARVILAPARGVDPHVQRIEVEGRAPIRYDLASFDIGSTVVGLDLPGVREHALPTRPIGGFVRRIGEIVTKIAGRRGSGTAQVLVVGGGAGGVEVAFCVEQRLRDAGLEAEISLLHNRARVLPRYPPSLATRIERAAGERGLRIRGEVTVQAAESGAVLLDSGERLPCDALIWVTGAASHPVFRDSGLPLDERGFLKVRPTLQVPGHDNLFAVGDCAHLVDDPTTPKAGVYAVRQGPFLTDNLRALLDGKTLRRYKPQSDFLTLLNLGDGSAVGAKWGLSFEGRWVMRLKDSIDRKFMRRFQVLTVNGGLRPGFSPSPPPAMADEPMLCGGCAAKVGQSVLERALRRVRETTDGRPHGGPALGLEALDDAAAWSPSAATGKDAAAGPLVVSSVDSFRAFTDDPWLVGRIGAVNALADLYATGAEPRLALALVTVPDEADAPAQEEMLYQVLAGARSIFDPLAVHLAGGHTTTGPELQVGFSVEGTADDESALLRLATLRAGDALVLTKPLGTGVLLQADRLGRARGPWIVATLASMQSTLAAAARAARRAGATAATDVTGFGLAGHLGEMLRRSGLSAHIELGAIPALAGALELLAQGSRSTFHEENALAKRSTYVPFELADDLRLELLFDPQTAGGLLIGIAPTEAEALLAELRAGDSPHAALIGSTGPRREDGALIEILPKPRHPSGG